MTTGSNREKSLTSDSEFKPFGEIFTKPNLDSRFKSIIAPGLAMPLEFSNTKKYSEEEEYFSYVVRFMAMVCFIMWIWRIVSLQRCFFFNADIHSRCSETGRVAMPAPRWLCCQVGLTNCQFLQPGSRMDRHVMASKPTARQSKLHSQINGDWRDSY